MSGLGPFYQQIYLLVGPAGTIGVGIIVRFISQLLNLAVGGLTYHQLASNPVNMRPPAHWFGRNGCIEGRISANLSPRIPDF